MEVAANIRKIKQELPEHVILIAVSKTKPINMILDAYHSGQRDFGENKVQEWQQKHPQLPADINWHLIGHLQTNKAKYVAGNVHLIHGVDSEKLLLEINKHAANRNSVQDCLLQLHIAKEDTKFGFSEAEAIELIAKFQSSPLPNVRIRGLMGMATYSNNENIIQEEFAGLRNTFNQIKHTYSLPHFDTLSMGMSSDYHIAIANGSNMIRIGSDIFGSRV
jgi:pyridoxal phosphate enzyme (YggS family)